MKLAQIIICLQIVSDKTIRLQFIQFINNSSYLKRAWQKCAKKIFLQVGSFNSVDRILKTTGNEIFLCILRQGVSFVHTNGRITYLTREGHPSV